MNLERCSGVLLHPTSLPGKYGVGTFGREAYEWVDFLARTQQTIWQILPLNPTSYGDSPYQSNSTFAGNPYLISLDEMTASGLLSRELLNEALASPEYNANYDHVDFGALYNWKLPLLDKAAAEFVENTDSDLHKEFEEFCQENKYWLDDYALFMALKKKFNKAWNEWPDEYRTRKSRALKSAMEECAQEIHSCKFIQWVFERQWNKLKEYAHEKGIKIVGDLPIFVAMDSADAWTNASQFYFDKNLVPTVVAGVPPDSFSTIGQLWGNPLYNWNKMKRHGYDWWIARIKAALKRQDIVRIDHFRGFAAYWEVPYGEETAINGKWVKGPGADLFKVIVEELGEDLPIIAEDLGVITPDVVELRDKFNLPGMKILQFAFGGNASHPFLPHNYTENFIAYTGTHDNNTARGWYENDAPDKDKHYVRRYFSTDGWDIAWTMMRGIFSSVAKVAIVPIQDILSLGNEARMNYPGKAENNWSWRFRKEMLNEHIEWRLTDLTTTYGREREKEPAPVDEDYEKAAQAAMNLK
ncbi:4-alpha-glucanotransferase [bacterium]|nr:4-alpha-glucanotransferase [bacterium]